MTTTKQHDIFKNVENDLLFQPCTNLPNATIIKIVIGRNTMYALTSQGEIVAQGSNEYGRLGIGVQDVQIAKYKSFHVIPEFAAHKHKIANFFCAGINCFVPTEAGVFVFGYNSEGNLGVGHRNDVYAPILCPGLSQLSIVQWCLGIYHSFVITTGGQVYAFGFNKSYQLVSNLQNYKM